MHPHTILTKIQAALQLSESQVSETWRLGNTPPLAKENSCTRDQLAGFLEGLILLKRGPKPGDAQTNIPSADALDNNAVLKKLRIALDMKEDAVLEVFGRNGVMPSKGELSSWTRKRGHKNYKECTDEQLTAFLDGLQAESGADLC